MSGDESQRSDSTKAAEASPGQSAPGTLDRRSFVLQATVLMSGLIVSSAMAAPVVTDASGIQLKEVKEIAGFLTGKSDLSDDLVSRAYTALLAEYTGFDRRLNNLIAHIHMVGLSDVEAFKNSSLAADPELMGTATAVVGALYTGRVGAGYQGHFVAYKDALMYRPTADVSVIPTYAHWGPGYWLENPK